MLKRLRNECIIRPARVKPSCDELKVVSAFNPGVIEVGDEVVILLRVAEAVVEQRQGQTGLPRWDTETGELVIDWEDNDNLDFIDPRVVVCKKDGSTRLTFTSHLQIIRTKDPFAVSDEAMANAERFDPANRYETFGVEDPRITAIDGVFYITYVSVSPHGACTSLASTTDFVRFQRHGVIFPPENKDVLLLPKRVSGRYVAIHRPNPSTHFTPPAMWLAYSDDLIHWGGHEQFLGAIEGNPETVEDNHKLWRMGRIGGGCPPIETLHGWLEIYHGNSKKPGSARDDVGVYSAGAILLAHDNPRKIVKQTTQPIMVPETEFETEGFVNNVVFPTGVVERDETLIIYYGAADAVTAVVEWSRDELLERME